MLLDLNTGLSRGSSGDLLLPSLEEFSIVCCDLHSQGFGVVSEAELDAFPECSRFFDDPENVGNLISGSAVFSKSSLNIWMFVVYILLKPGLENFDLYSANV